MKRKLTHLGFIFFLFLGFNLGAYAQVQVGTGTNESQSLPIEPFYGYSYTQVIYLASEINASGDITELQWYFSGTSLSNSNDWTIYIGHTTKTSFVDGDDWVAVGDMDQVFSATFTDPGAAGWITFDITDWAYNGTDNIVVAVDENASSWNGSSDDFYCTSVTDNRGIYYRSDGTNPDPSAPPTANGTPAYIANIIFGGITQACPTPTDQTETNITTTTAELGWTENGSATAWNIEYGPTGFTQGSGTTVAAGTNPYTLTGLSAATTYDWYVQSDCGSNWTGPSTFTTACATYTAPYTEDFENAGTIPNCWSQGAANAEDWKFSNTGSGNHLGNNGTMGGSTTSGAYFAWVDDSSPHSSGTTLESPYIDVSGLTTPELSFFVISDNEGYTNVDFSVDIWDGAAWNTGYYTRNTNTLNGEWEEIHVSLSSLTITGDMQFRFIVDENNGTDFYDDVAIDDVTVDEAPACPTPTVQTETNITTTTAELGWTENGSATAWNIEYGPTGFTQGSGTTVAAGTNPYTLTGLTANTTYDWYVQADCGGGWAGASTFTTLQAAAPVQSLPFTEDWETGAIGAAWNYDAGSVSTIEVNTASVHDGTYGLEQYGNNASFTTPADLADAYTKALPGGTNENWTTWNKMSVDLSTATNPWLSFWYAMGYQYNNNYNNFWVQVSTDGSTWTDLFSTQTNGAAIPYEKKDFDLSAYIGTAQLFIRFFHNGKYNTNYLWLDDISVQNVNCPDPSDQVETNIAATSADLGWTENGSATTWNIEWGPAGFTQGSGTMITGTTTNPHSLTGLTEFTAYDWYVQADCGAGSTSAWVGPSTFSTLCTSCCSHSVELIDTYGDGWNGGYLDVYVDGNLVLDGITLTAGGGPQTNYFDALTGSDIDVYYTAGSYPTENEYTVYDGAAAMLGQSGQGGATPGDLLDLVGNCPSCPPPTDQTVSAITTSSADLGWTAGGTESNWNIEWGLEGFTQGSGTLVANTADNPYTLTGLSDATTYDWYVQADCDGGAREESTWVGPNTFTTACNPTSIPYFQNFDAETVPDFPLCMVVEDGNTDGIVWQTSSTHLSAPNAAKILYNSSLDMDDWFFTRGLQLTAGTTYEVSFAYAAGSSSSYSEKLAVDWGTDATSASMSGTPIFDETDILGGWYSGNGSFTPATTGTYYVGFHGYSDADELSLFVDDIKVIEAVAATSWAGTVDNDWDTPGNWSNGLPASNTDVTIPTGLTNYPTVASATTIGSLLVESDATGDASVLNDGLLIVSGDATVQRFVSGGVWHDISASTQGQTVNSIFFGGSPEVWLARRNEPTNDWTYLTDLNDPMDPGAGFDIWVESGSDVTVNYTGALQRADLDLTTTSTPPLSYTVGTPQSDYGFNLIGNPFASPIDLDEGGWGPTDVSTSFWVWDQAGSTYKDWNTATVTGSLTDGIVPMGQGFFCQATGAAPAITIPMSARVHSAQPYYKSSTAEGEILQMSLRAIMDRGYDEMNIVFLSEATETFDTYDTRKMFATFGNAAQIYSEQFAEKVSINSLPLLTDEGYSVKVGYQTGVDGDQILEARLDKLPETEVFLEDLVSGNMQSLNDNPRYEFEAAVGDEPVRFVLHFRTMGTGIGDAENEDLISIYAFDHKLYIKSSGTAAKESKQIWVYDLFGRTAIRTTAEASTLTSIPVHHLNGYVIVKVMSESGVKTAKVYIK